MSISSVLSFSNKKYAMHKVIEHGSASLASHNVPEVRWWLRHSEIARMEAEHWPANESNGAKFV
jgi:hypothetical protein